LPSPIAAATASAGAIELARDILSCIAESMSSKKKENHDERNVRNRD
jgi:hypothetical protein